MRRLYNFGEPMASGPKRALLALLLLALQLTAASSPPKKRTSRKTSLATQIKSVLNQPQIDRAYWGIEARDLETGKMLYSLHADQFFLPASNAKLFTTAGALWQAKRDYRFVTTVEAEGKIENGRLHGDLAIMGRGDPNISGRVLPYALKTERQPPHTQVLEDLANQVASMGLKVVEGDVLGDDTFYSPERYGTGWAQDDLQWIDGAPVSALTFNDNVVFLSVLPGQHEGDEAPATLEPGPAFYEIDNRVRTTAAGGKREIGVHREIGSKKVLLWGSLPLGDAGYQDLLAVDDPADFTAQVFRSLLEKREIHIAGTARARHGDRAQFFDNAAQGSASRPDTLLGNLAPLPQTATDLGASVLARHDSLPFLEDIRVTNKASQNLHAELALRLVGKLGGQGGSIAGGRAVLSQFLLQAGLKEEDFVLLDGSGLSRRDLVTPSAVVQLLSYVARQPWGIDFEGTLPIAGVDGTLSGRFQDTPAAGLVHAKTGTLSHVNALSGYGETVTGRRFVFSIFCNNHNLNSEQILPAIDSIVEALVTVGGRPSSSAPHKPVTHKRARAAASQGTKAR